MTQHGLKLIMAALQPLYKLLRKLEASTAVQTNELLPYLVVVIGSNGYRSDWVVSETNNARRLLGAPEIDAGCSECNARAQRFQ